MNPRSCLVTAASAGILLVTLASALPAVADSPPRDAAPSAAADVAASELGAPGVLSLEKTGRTKFVVRVDALPGTELTVRDARGLVVGRTAATSALRQVGVTWNPQDAPSARRFTVTQSRDGVTSEATPFRLQDASPEVPGQPAAPRIGEVTVTGGVATIPVSSATTTGGLRAVVSDFYGTPVASAPLTDGAATLMLAAPSAATMLLVTIVDGDSGLASLPIDVTLRSDLGALVPAAPTPSAITTTGERSVTTISGRPGAHVTVRDAGDRVVAVARIGVSGSTQIALPAAATATEYTAVQALSVIESDPSTIVVPAM